MESLAVGHQAIARLSLQAHRETGHRAIARRVRGREDTANHAHYPGDCRGRAGDVRIAEIEQQAATPVGDASAVRGRERTDDVDLRSARDRVIGSHADVAHVVGVARRGHRPKSDADARPMPRKAHDAMASMASPRGRLARKTAHTSDFAPRMLALSRPGVRLHRDCSQRRYTG